MAIRATGRRAHAIPAESVASVAHFFTPVIQPEPTAAMKKAWPTNINNGKINTMMKDKDPHPLFLFCFTIPDFKSSEAKKGIAMESGSELNIT